MAKIIIVEHASQSASQRSLIVGVEEEGGITGQLYRQFALTISAAVIISTITIQ